MRSHTFVHPTTDYSYYCTKQAGYVLDFTVIYSDLQCNN